MARTTIVSRISVGFHPLNARINLRMLGLNLWNGMEWKLIIIITFIYIKYDEQIPSVSMRYFLPLLSINKVITMKNRKTVIFLKQEQIENKKTLFIEI